MALKLDVKSAKHNQLEFGIITGDIQDLQHVADLKWPPFHKDNQKGEKDLE